MSNISRRSFIQGSLALGASAIIPTGLKAQDVNTLKFIHATDTHMDFMDISSIEAMELMVEFINREYKDLDFVLFGGDNYNNNIKDNKDAVMFKFIVEKLHCPYYIVRGNKESSPTSSLKSVLSKDFDNIFLQNEKLYKNGRDWLVKTKGYQILGLDSSVEHHYNGLYTKETLEFAEKTLKSGKPTIILNHHPYTNYWKGTDKEDIKKHVLGNTEEVQKRLFKYPNLILTLSGHKHIDSVTRINQTKVIVTRAFERPLDINMYPMRYVEILGSNINEKIIYTS
ncbi:hypothetical protein FJR48_00580 [Sulfurimonas lithotrophica]|uniref:Calcineurin-like phosphoesterase domain-containing protein n=1 Tax=Sulfurimonas lithotrophica TaxID=2590022 RepID=A0A5P8NY09_9BACT|nr:metallophosphoesterase [Sulfurimonas lithotrophica]QFR48297.1 hypothetical protein FJR48_00580 [Sulfurimonas lithotrophica]